VVNALKLYFRYLGISFRGQMQYRASFIMMSMGAFLVTGIEFVGIWALFDRFGTLRGWSLAEIALFYGIVNMSMALSKMTSRGFDHFSDLIRTGDFDRLLLRPRSTPLQLLGQELQLMRVGRFSQGLIVLVWAFHVLDLPVLGPRLLLTAGAVIGGACIFTGLFILQATLAFWTIESLEIVNSVTYGGVEAARYPLSIYRPWFRHLFTFVIPLAFANYFPSVVILGRADPLGYSALLGWLAPFLGAAFLGITLQIWKLGTRHYRSTGS
jgi:ABC-2 type transport system permease protein